MGDCSLPVLAGFYLTGLGLGFAVRGPASESSDF